eukprot:TRINITY_DN67306_c1_g1_i1.p1 TRINITY_DN67306_c1_g1~~TRINITY_DN67306_c1_g1_i1.p1  ORF type:complete len:342 (+),score=187.52 TRINITY_DN67306_c1_g1_i1:54-1079(+)
MNESNDVKKSLLADAPADSAAAVPYDPVLAAQGKKKKKKKRQQQPPQGYQGGATEEVNTQSASGGAGGAGQRQQRSRQESDADGRDGGGFKCPTSVEELKALNTQRNRNYWSVISFATIGTLSALLSVVNYLQIGQRYQEQNEQTQAVNDNSNESKINAFFRELYIVSLVGPAVTYGITAFLAHRLKFLYPDGRTLHWSYRIAERICLCNAGANDQALLFVLLMSKFQNVFIATVGIPLGEELYSLWFFFYSSHKTAGLIIKLPLSIYHIVQLARKTYVLLLHRDFSQDLPKSLVVRQAWIREFIDKFDWDDEVDLFELGDEWIESTERAERQKRAVGAVV